MIRPPIEPGTLQGGDQVTGRSQQRTLRRCGMKGSPEECVVMEGKGEEGVVNCQALLRITGGEVHWESVLRNW